VARLASSLEPCHDGAGIPRKAARRSSANVNARGRTKQTERKESKATGHCFLNHSPQLGITVYAIRHLLAHAVLIQQKTLAMLFHWMDWRISHNENARIAHYRMRLNMQL
jgi:hypothetical protein